MNKEELLKEIREDIKKSEARMEKAEREKDLFTFNLHYRKVRELRKELALTSLKKDDEDNREWLETIDFGFIEIVDKKEITKFDKFITCINVDGINDCSIYEVAEGYMVAVFD